MRFHSWRMAVLTLALGSAVIALATCGGGEQSPGARSGREAAPPEGAPATFDPSASDEAAIVTADRLLSALGGAEAWAATRNLVFTFAVARGDTELTRRTHFWDRVSGRHRVEGIDRNQNAFVVIHNLADSTLMLATVGGEPVEEPERRALIREHAQAMWVNDTYWLLMPYKLKDPGVHLAYEGTKSEGDRTWDVIHMRFDRVGLTPGDQYWAYVNRETGLMDRWAFRLESMPPDAEPRQFDWMNWRRYGRILLSDAKVAVGGEQRIFFPRLAVFDELPESVFTSTEPQSLPAL